MKPRRLRYDQIFTDKFLAPYEEESQVEDNHMYKKPFLSRLFFELNEDHSRCNRLNVANAVFNRYYGNDAKQFNSNCSSPIRRRFPYDCIANKMNAVYKRVIELSSKPSLIGEGYFSLMQSKYNKMLSSKQSPNQKLFSTEVKQQSQKETSPESSSRQPIQSKSNNAKPIMPKLNVNIDVSNLGIKRKPLRRNNFSPINSTLSKIKFTEIKPLFPLLPKEENGIRIKDYEMYDLVYNYKHKGKQVK